MSPTTGGRIAVCEDNYHHGYMTPHCTKCFPPYAETRGEAAPLDLGPIEARLDSVKTMDDARLLPLIAAVTMSARDVPALIAEVKRLRAIGASKL